MAELTAESTFRECAEFYLNNKLLTSASGTDAISQKSKCSNNIFPIIGDVAIKNLNYSECKYLLSEVRNKNYSKTYICACWFTIKQVINMSVEMGLIEKPDFYAITAKDMFDDIDIYASTNVVSKLAKPIFTDLSNLDDFVITRHSSVFTYLLFLHNNNNIRKHHIIPKYILTSIYKIIDIDILNKPLNEVNQYDIKRINHDIRLLGYSSESIRLIMTLLRFVFTSAYENGLINSNMYDYFKVPRYNHENNFHFNDEEYRAIKDAINTSNLKNLYIVAESAALLRSEVLAIETDSFNLEEGTLTINNRIITSEKREYIKEKCVTTNRRTIKLPDAAIEAFNNEIEKREEKRLLAGEKWNDESNALFTDTFGNRISVEILKFDLCKIRAISGVKSFNLLKLRKNAIYLMTARDIPLFQIKEYLGLKEDRYIPGAQKKTNKVSQWRERIV